MAERKPRQSPRRAPATAADGDRSAGDGSSARGQGGVGSAGIAATRSTARIASRGSRPAGQPPLVRHRWRERSAARLAACWSRRCCGGWGAFPARQELPADPGPRLAAIEKQLKDLAARPLPAAVDAKEITKEVNKAVDEVGARVSRLEAAQAAPRAPVTDPVVLGRLTAVEGASKSLADNVAALSRRADATDAAIRDTNAAVRDTNANIGKLSAALGEVRATARAAAAGSDSASRLALAASVLRDAAERGEPFVAELAVAKPLTHGSRRHRGAGAVRGLGRAGQRGARPAACRDHPADAWRRRDYAAGDHGRFWKKLQANAETLVRISPTDGKVTGGNERDAILARAEQRAAQGNVAGAREELSKASRRCQRAVPGLDCQGGCARQSARRQPRARRRRGRGAEGRTLNPG